MIVRFMMLILLAGKLSLPTFADVYFCGGPGGCTKLKIKNSASVTVRSVIFTQLENGGKCPGIKKTATQNLAGGTSTSESYNVFLKAECGYKIRFKTTKGCGGKKTKNITSEQLENGLKSVILKGPCGSLKVDKKK